MSGQSSHVLHRKHTEEGAAYIRAIISSTTQKTHCRGCCLRQGNHLMYYTENTLKRVLHTSGQSSHVLHRKHTVEGAAYVRAIISCTTQKTH